MDPKQGIMALPESDQAPAPQLSLDESYDAVRQGLQNASPQASQMVDQAMQQFKPMLEQLDDKDLNRVLQIIQYLKENEAKYPELLQNLIDRGALKPGVFPEEYNPEFLATLMMVLTAEKKDRQQAPQPEMAPPPGMARGGIADAARAVMSQGRSGDTMLAHINPREAKILEAHGGMGTINPTTGLREYSFWSDPIGSISGSLNDLGNSVKEVVSSPVGKILTTVALAYVLGPAAFGLEAGAALGLASAGTTLMAGGDLKDALISGATAYFAAPGGVLSGAVPISNMALNAAVTSGLVGTAGGLLQGKNLEDSVKAGLTQAVISGATTGLTKGFTAGGAGPVKLDVPSTTLTETTGTPSTGTDVSQGATTGVKTFADESALGNAMKTGDVKPGDFVNVKGANYQFTPQLDSPYYFKSVDVNGQTIGGGIEPAAQMAAKTGNLSPVAPTQGGYNPDVNAATQSLSGVAPPASVAPTQGGYSPNVQAATDALSPYAPPRVQGMGESLGKIGSGVKEIFTGPEGSFNTGLEKVTGGISDLYSPSLSKEQLMQTPEYLDAIGKGRTMTEALEQATKANAPSMIRSYAPGVATAIGATYAMGGFDPKQQPKSEQQSAMEDHWNKQRADVAANPGDYYSKGMERFGLVYNDKGEVVGGNPWSSASTGPTEVASAEYVPYKPSIYSRNKYVRLYADGGIASLASGGYPRRTGQIAGPGTETSDSIPAMLSDGEFVVTAKAVRGAGNGSRLAGAKKMYALMHQLERNASRK